MSMRNKCWEESFRFIMCITGNIQAIPTKRGTVNNKPLGHEKNPLKVFHGHLQCIKNLGYFPLRRKIS